MNTTNINFNEPLKEWKKSNNSGVLSYNSQYPDQIMIFVAKHRTTILTKVFELLGDPKFIKLHSGNTVWAISGSDVANGCYTIQCDGEDRSKSQPKYISPTAFLKKNSIPIGYYYVGVFKDGMIYFSKTPSGQI